VNSIEDPQTDFYKYGRRVFEDIKYSPSMVQIFMTFKEWARKLHVNLFHKDIEEFFMSIVSDTIDYREKNEIARNDFLHLLIQLKNNGKLDGDLMSVGKLSLNEIAAQCFIFFAAGYETSSTTMSFG
jgi:cytochrome P450 family 6